MSEERMKAPNIRAQFMNKIIPTGLNSNNSSNKNNNFNKQLKIMKKFEIGANNENISIDESDNKITMNINDNL